MIHRLNLQLLDARLAVCRLDPHAAIPDWAWQGEIASVTRTRDELSVVCSASAVPAGIKAQLGWRAFRVVGTQDFALVGILASLTAPLAEAGISLFALATFDTDYLLVQEDDLPRAIAALRARGHHVADPV